MSDEKPTPIPCGIQQQSSGRWTWFTGEGDERVEGSSSSKHFAQADVAMALHDLRQARKRAERSS